MIAVLELMVGSTETVAATLIGPNPAVNLLAVPALALLVEVVTVSLATRYFPSQSRFRLMVEKSVVELTGLTKVQEASKTSAATVAVVQTYQV